MRSFPMKKTVVNFSPDWLARHRLTNLWDMIVCEPGKLAVALLALGDYQTELKKIASEVGWTQELSGSARKRLNDLIGRMRDHCHALDVPVSLNRAEEIGMKLGGFGPACTYHLLDSEIEDFRTALRQELYRLHFVFIPANKAQFAEQPALRGDFFTFLSVERDSKLIINWRVGKRDQENTVTFLQDLRARVPEHFQLTPVIASPVMSVKQIVETSNTSSVNPSPTPRR